MISKNILIIFVKHPQPGLVKTRLAKDIGKRRAASLYKGFVDIIVKRNISSRFKIIIFYTPSNRENEIRRWLGEKFEYQAQDGKDLGERILNAFAFVFAQGAKKIIIIGTDSPLVGKNVVIKAFTSLENAECVIGPSYDGGYYLLGLSRFCKGIFTGIDWGTDRVRQQTVKVLEDLSIKYSLGDADFDIDRLGDLKLFRASLRHRKDKDFSLFAPIMAKLDRIK